MPYIAFVGMIGTRASALASNQEYTDAINDFNNSLKQVSSICQCTIYGYSDNAYIQIENLSDMISFFRILRATLMNKHRYFVATVDTGSLKSERVPLEKHKGFSMKFTDPTTVDIYMQQCQFSGIGIYLSKSVVDNLKEQNIQDTYCQSVFQRRLGANNEIVPFYDLSYNSLIFENLEYIISDYLITSTTDERAGRYYITPVISMIKSLDKEALVEDIDKLISLLSFQVIPDAFRSLPNNEEYSLFFMFALIECILSLREQDKSIDATKICERIIKGYNVNNRRLVEGISSISTAIITNINKRKFINILYNMK